MRCPNCSSTHFRNSHFRLSDLQWLLVLYFPVRCSRCYERYYTNLLLAWEISRAHLAYAAKRKRISPR